MITRALSLLSSQITGLAAQVTCSAPTAWGAQTAVNPPSPRAYASLTPSPDGSSAYLFGGQLASGAVVNDIFMLSSAAGFTDAGAGPTSELTNIAALPAVQAWMSSSFNASYATLALTPSSLFSDALGNLLCAVTTAELSPWWALDLGSSQAIASVTVFQVRGPRE